MAGAYTVTATNAAGCTATASGTLTVNALPAPTVNSPVICAGGTATLTATGGTSYVWSTGATTTSITASVAGAYTVTATNAAGCTATASGTLTVNANPAPSVAGTTAICAGTSTVLTASGGTGYTWSTGATTAAITVSAAGTYRVTASNASGCTASAGAAVSINALPTPTVNSPTVCTGSTATLTATGGTGYAWSTGATTTAITTASAGTYTVTATNAAGCTATASGTVSLYTLPSVTASAASPICAGATLALSAVGSGSVSYSYAWTGPNSFSAATASPSINNATTAATGTYTVTVTDNNSCTATASASATIADCRSISGKVFDDANGDGVKAAGEPATTFGNTLYGVLSDGTSGLVLQVSSINGSGAFSFSNIMPNTSGLRVRISTTAPAIGAAAPASTWPSGWVGTLGQYGASNLAGSGVSPDTTSDIAVSVGTSDVTNILIGYDQLPTTAPHSYNVAKPARNSTWKLNAGRGVGLLGGTDPEDGPLGVGHKFVITSVAALNGNKLYYDADGNTVLAAYEQITGYTVITSFDSSRLYMVFSGFASNSASFSYTTVDAAGKSDPASSIYNINWQVALPVKLISFEAEKTNDNQVQLRWATASEIDNDHFDIERSADAKEWSTIGEVKGAGTTNAAQQYSIRDRQPLAGTSYYRLRQVDYDGQYEYSEIRAVSISEATATTMAVYPNPAATGTGVNVVLGGSTETIRYIRITSQMGAVVYGTEVNDEQSYRLQGLDLPVGVYTINILTNTGTRHSSKVTIH